MIGAVTQTPSGAPTDWALIVAIAGLFLALGIPILGWVVSHFRGVDLEIELRDIASREDLIERYQGRSADAYFAALKRILGFADRIYGTKALSWRAYSTSLTIAYAYPIFAIIFGWVLFNINAPAGIEMFRDTPSLLERFIRLIILIGGWAAAVVIAIKTKSFRDYVVARLFKSVDTSNSRTGFLAKAVRLFFVAVAVAGAIAGVVAVAGAGAIAGAVAAVVAVAGVVAVAVAAVVAIAGAVAGIVAGTGAVAVAAVVAIAGAGAPETTSLILLLYVLLPLLNAAADMISLWVTRHFLSQIVNHRPQLWFIIGQMLLDLILAAACLCLLVVSIISGLTVWEWISPTTLPVVWSDYWADVKTAPQNGVALYIMALTTLVPTIIHLFAGLSAVLTQKSRSLQKVAAELGAQPRDKALPETRISNMKKQIGRATFWGYVGAAVVISGVFAPLIFGVYRWVT
ncbi:hypothetical protein Z948_2497 [Sulfitobacter donghicola DSW-25 = KCTC 12864 = JCM 14565]|nr:hypothetical protein Z948_2497 [Sulfitobacter donghicola DSW-25 = KCTC 12864 = JCM 14565]